MDLKELSKLLPGITPEELKQLEKNSLERKFLLHSFSKEEIFIPKQGKMYLVIEGGALAEVYTDEGLEFHAEFKPGECMGQFSTFVESDMDAFLKGLDSCTVLEIPIEEILQKTDIQFLANVYQKMLTVTINGLLKVINDYAVKVNFSNEQYFVNFLIARGGTYTPTSMEDFAHILHIEVRTLQRIIKKLTEKKIVQKSNKTIQIIDMESAKEIVNL